MTPVYYNTTNEAGEALAIARDETARQDARIYNVFTSMTRDGTIYLNPWAVHEIIGTNVPITSIRRSMNTLTNEGKIEKTTVKVRGPYGRPCYCWKLV